VCVGTGRCSHTVGIRRSGSHVAGLHTSKPWSACIPYARPLRHHVCRPGRRPGSAMDGIAWPSCRGRLLQSFNCRLRQGAVDRPPCGC
jgi:hypothetical protein